MIVVKDGLGDYGRQYADKTMHVYAKQYETY
jgi:hypothetical protein